jgi:cytidylate kinase
MPQARVVGLGGDSGAGKGVGAAAIYECAVQRYGSRHSRSFDQGALYRFATLKTLQGGAQSEAEILANGLTLIESTDPDTFLDQFDEIFSDPERSTDLRSQDVSSAVAIIGESEQAQVFFRNMLNLRIGRACADGAEVIVIDSRTPRVLADIATRRGEIAWALQIYMATNVKISASWAAMKTGKPYAECLRSLQKRNDLDSQRTSFPNFAPNELERTDFHSLNYNALTGRARNGSLWLPDEHLHLLNDGTFPMQELERALREIAAVALMQLDGEIEQI